MANYSLTAPSQNAYEPTNVEAALASQLGGPNANYLGGHIFNAQMQRQAGQRDYELALRNTNTMQRDLSQQHMASELEQEKIKLEGQGLAHPGSWRLSRTLNGRIAPGAERLADRHAEAGVGLNEARVRSENGLATERFSDSGVAPPQGTGYSLSGVPSAPSAQGVRPDIVREGMQQAGANYRDGTGGDDLARLDARGRVAYANAEQRHNALVAQELRRLEDGIAKFTNESIAMPRQQRDAAIAQMRQDGNTRIAQLRNTAPQLSTYLRSGAPPAAPATTASAAVPAPGAAVAPSSQPGNVPAGQPQNNREATVRGRELAATMRDAAGRSATYVGRSASNGKAIMRMPDGSTVEVLY